MKLRNKRTGEVVSIYEILTSHDTLAELNEEWKDYEEPEEYWTISGAGYLWTTEHMTPDTINDLRRIGNLFETEEEAEKAVEKLKAWKRLKDKGLVWQGWEEGSLDNGMCIIGCQIPENNWETDVVEDLDLLFGGEE